VTERLYRHPTDRVIAGVAGGLGVWLNIDPSLVRIAWVLLAVFSGGIFVLVYIVMMIVVPLAPVGWAPRPRDGYGPGAGWQPGPGAWGASGDPSAPWGSAPGGIAGTPPEAGSGPSAGTGGGPTPGATGWPFADGSPAPSWGTPPPGGWPQGQPWTPPRPGNAGLVVGVVLVVMGLWFLVDRYVHIDWNLLWPVVIMVLGGGLIAAALMRDRSR
jgi:phage shock protein C